MFPCRSRLLLLPMLPKHFLFEAELDLVVVVTLQAVGHLRSQKLVVMDNHWFEAAAVLEAAKQLRHSFLRLHLSSHLC